jgi:hypothetical protein
MKKTIFFLFIAAFFLALTSFAYHKFYMGVYQINFAPEKKMVQITTRIFVDDLNKALEKKYNKKLFLGTEKESSEEMVLLKKYLSDNFTLKINGQTKSMNFLSKEIEADVLVCYLNIKEITKINSIEIYNTVLIDWNLEQQNIVHFSMPGNKQSFLFTDSSTLQLLKF